MLTRGVEAGLIVIGGFESLLHLSVFSYLFNYVLLTAGVIIVRSRQPDTDRSYQALVRRGSNRLGTKEGA